MFGQVSVFLEAESPDTAPFLDDFGGWRSSGIRVTQCFTHKTNENPVNVEVRTKGLRRANGTCHQITRSLLLLWMVVVVVVAVAVGALCFGDGGTVRSSSFRPRTPVQLPCVLSSA